VGVPRTSAGSVLFTSYNVLDLFDDESPAGQEHYRLVVESIRALGTDVLAVQEIRAKDRATARARLERLAADTGLACTVPGADTGRARPALAMGPRGYHVGLLWRDGIEPVPGSLRCYGRGDFWHSLAMVSLDVGGVVVRHAAHHSTPFCRQLRADQNERLVAAVRRPAAGAPTLVGADWNTESADRVYDEATGTWPLYEPRDPYAGVDWFESMLFQCDWDYDDKGQRRHWADRRPGDVLWAGGLHDAAAVLGAPWQATVGHHPTDGYGRRGVHRRIDAVRVTTALTGALRACTVTDTDLTRRASDHLPVTVEYVPPPECPVPAEEPAPA
jgi:endonuclease/exonuclease/phosphatase family metal-dependent hydrolase